MRAEFRRQAEDVRRDCGTFDLKHIADCAITLTTGHPLHIAVGSLAPQNGLGIGLALVGHFPTTEKWATSWSTDVVGSFSRAWRAGAYVKFVNTNVKPVVVIDPNAPLPPPPSPADAAQAYPVYTAYFQGISLPKLVYYGLGPLTTQSDRSFFGLGQTIVGGNAIVPIRRAGRVNLSVLGEMNGRFVDVRQGRFDDRPSIEELYAEATAPGLTMQPGFLQFGLGTRIKPSLLNGAVNLNYLLQFQQFIAPSDSTYSFQRWNLDLNHEIPLYRDSRPPATVRDANTPNQCAIDPTVDRCPSVSRNRTGTVGFRMLVSRSSVGSDSVVPFYFQRTLGGSDINGERVLASYDDYRFRGPHLFLLQESIEHSLGTWPVGVWLAAEQGKVSLQRQQNVGDAGDFRDSVAAGLTLRAGGFPVVVLSFATGGSEGGHVAFTVGTSLLGGSPRPSIH